MSYSNFTVSLREPHRHQKPKTKRKKNSVKIDSDSEHGDGEASIDANENDASYKPNAKSARSSGKHRSSKKDNNEDKPLKKGVKAGTELDGDDAAEADEPRWMEKYRTKDLKGGKGDLEGLFPYLVAQISEIETEIVNGSKGAASKVCVSCIPSPGAAFLLLPWHLKAKLWVIQTGYDLV